STVFRPNVLIFLPAVLLWGLWSLRERRHLILPCAALYLLGLWLPLLPFQIRNRAVDPSRGWGLTTSSGGVNFYLGNNPEADGLNQAPSFIRYGPGHQYGDFKKEAERKKKAAKKKAADKKKTKKKKTRGKRTARSAVRKSKKKKPAPRKTARRTTKPAKKKKKTAARKTTPRKKTATRKKRR
ncbi:MAG: hypothetical protein IIB58_08230, partial [Planctomycetes bacterium]|nr:hypothetical protein [Planctomycetota bacterium]